MHHLRITKGCPTNPGQLSKPESKSDQRRRGKVTDTIKEIKDAVGIVECLECFGVDVPPRAVIP